MKRLINIGIVGEGKMGTSIFLYLNHLDFKLRWLCSSENGREEADRLFSKKMKSQLHCAVVTEEEYAAKIKNTLITANPGDFAECELILEAIPEDIHLKRKLFGILDSVVRPGCIFTTNSSSIVPSRLIPSDKRKENFAGLHFFFPVQLKKYVELIKSDWTSDDTFRILDEFLTEIHKKSFIQDEHSAFLLNRLFLDLQACAYHIYLEGRLSFKEIDHLVKAYLFPFGVFEFFDHVGIDVMLASVRTYSGNAVNKGFYSPLINKMEELIRKNHLGIKTKRGFYTYDPPVKRDFGPTEHLMEEYERQVLERLWDYYKNSVQKALDSGVIGKDDLAEAIKDYAGIDRDPFIFPI